GALYNIVHKGKVYFYQSGRRTDLPQNIRVGIVLHAHAIRTAIEAGYREYDFLAGSSRYKRALTTESRPIVSLRATRGRALEGARLLAADGLERLRARMAANQRGPNPSQPDSASSAAAD